MTKIQTRKLMIPLATVMIMSFLLSACKNKSESNEDALAALALAVTDSSSNGSTPVTQLVFFATDNSGSGWGNGNLGGRSGTDTKCANAKPAGLSCPNGNHALLSFSASDQIKDMPTKYGFSNSLPVKAWDGTKINDTILSEWSAMLLGGSSTPFNPTLSTAFGLSGLPYLATGSDANGNVSTNNCSGFTSATGIFEDVDMGNGSFFPEGGGDCSNFQSNFADAYLICVCY